MGLWTDYTKKDTPEDNDTLMLYDAAGKENKQTLFSGFWKWVAKKLKEATLSDLETTNKTMIGAINELNSNRFSIYKENVSDLDNPPSAFILNTGVNPKGLPNFDYGNGCCVIQHNPGNRIYTAQLAFSFGSDKIAIRRRRNGAWSDWAYFLAQ